GELDRTGMVAAGDVRRNGIEVRPNLRGHPPTICPPPEFPCGRASHVQFLPKIRNRPYAGFMSGTYDDLAPLRVGDDMATEGESEPDRRPAAHQQVPITVVEPEGNARGGIVLLHESSEFTGPLPEIMQAYATEGWTAVAPNPFHRRTHST